MKISIIILLLLAGIIMSSCDPNELVVPEEPKEEEPVDKILFQGPTGNLYTVEINGNNQTRVFEKKEYQSIRFASLSPNGDKIVTTILSLKTNTSSTFILSLIDNTIREIESEIIRIMNVVWSPDSKKILYSCRENGLWIASKDGSSVKIGDGRVNRIIDGKSREVSNIYHFLNFFCNDKVLFSHADRYFYPDGRSKWISYGAYIMNDDGSNKRSVVYNTLIQNLILLSTNKIIYQPYISNSDFSDTYLLHLGTGTKLDLAVINKHVSFLISCPKGKKIAYAFFRQEERPQKYDIYIMNMENQISQLVKTTDNSLRNLQFSYCGKRIITSTQEGIFAINVDGTGKMKIAEGWMFEKW